MSKLVAITTEEFVKRAKELHGDTYVYDKAVYVGRAQKLIITCKQHGDFEQRAGHHLQGQGCKACGLARMTESQKTWSEIDLSFLKENYITLGGVKCSEALNKPLNTLYHKARELKLFKNSKKLNHPYISGRIWSNIVNNSKLRGLRVEITPDDIYNKYIEQNKCCALSGRSLDLTFSPKTNTVSVDRIDSSGHYTLDNIQIVDKRLNQCKMDLTDREFYKVCKQVYFNLKEKFE